MSRDDKARFTVICFLVLAITANEAGLPLIAVSALVMMPIGAWIASKTMNSKQKK